MKTAVYSTMILSLLVTAPVMAATNAGDKSIDGNISWSHTEPDEGENSVSTVSASGGFSYYYTDAISLGINVGGSWTLPDEGEDSSTYGVYLRSNYNFNTSGKYVPYVGVSVGMDSYEYEDNSETSFSWGGQVGVQTFITDELALTLEANSTVNDVATNYGLFLGLSQYF